MKLGKIFSAILAIPFVLLIFIFLIKGFINELIEALSIIFPIYLLIGIVIWRTWFPKKSAFQKWLGRISALLLLPITFFLFLYMMQVLLHPTSSSNIVFAIGTGSSIFISTIIINWILWIKEKND